MNWILICQYVLYGLEFLACITGFIYWRKIKNSYWKWFPVYLAIIVAAEMTGNYLNIVGTKSAIQLKLNIFNYAVIPLEFLFFQWIYLKNANNKKAFGLVIFCMALYIAGFFVDQFYFFNKKYFFSSFSYCIGNLALLVCIISYFIQMSRSNDIIHFRSNMIFWVSLGLLIFYLGTFPFYAFFWEIWNHHKLTFKVYTYVSLICNWIMYSLFIVSFIWSKPKST